MNTETSLFLNEREPAPTVRVASLTRGKYIDFDRGAVSIHGTNEQIDAIVAQFQNEHTKRLTAALRVLMGMSDDSSDEEVQLAASIRLHAPEQRIHATNN